MARSLYVPGSPSAPFTTTVVGTSGSGARLAATVRHFTPVGNPAPPRPRRPAASTSSTRASGSTWSALSKARPPPCSSQAASEGTGSADSTRDTRVMAAASWSLRSIVVLPDLRAFLGQALVLQLELDGLAPGDGVGVLGPDLLGDLHGPLVVAFVVVVVLRGLRHGAPPGELGPCESTLALADGIRGARPRRGDRYRATGHVGFATAGPARGAAAPAAPAPR